jgi:hypothetical protein
MYVSFWEQLVSWRPQAGPSPLAWLIDILSIQTGWKTSPAS